MSENKTSATKIAAEMPAANKVVNSIQKAKTGAEKKSARQQLIDFLLEVPSTSLTSLLSEEI